MGLILWLLLVVRAVKELLWVETEEMYVRSSEVRRH